MCRAARLAKLNRWYLLEAREAAKNSLATARIVLGIPEALAAGLLELSVADIEWIAEQPEAMAYAPRFNKRWWREVMKAVNADHPPLQQLMALRAASLAVTADPVG